jgi:hypothetical protein
MSKAQRGGLVKAGDLLAELNITPPDQPVPPAPLHKQLASLGQAIERREADRIVQLPLWYEEQRGTPNSFLRSALFAAIQSKDRKHLKGATIASSKDIIVKFTGEQLNQEDLSVWETLVHLAREHPLGNVCQFTAYGLLKMLGLHTGGDEHRRLHTTITRMIACAVEIKHEGRTYIGSLIEDAASIEDEPTKYYALRLNPTLIRLYGETQWTALNWRHRLQLRRKPLALALHGYYSTHARPVPVKLSTLQAYTGSANAQTADFKRKVKTALTELKTLGFLSDFYFERDLVIVCRA